MEWLDDPNIRLALVGLVTYLIKQLMEWMKMQVPPGTLTGAAEETVDLLSVLVDKQRDQDGKLNLPYIETLRKDALAQLRKYLLAHKPSKWIPCIFWTMAVNRIDDKALMTAIEGALELIKQKKNNLASNLL